MDEVPKDWLPPYEGEGNGSSLFRPESDKRAASKPSLQSKRQGMQQIMGSRRAGYVPHPSQTPCLHSDVDWLPDVVEGPLNYMSLYHLLQLRLGWHVQGGDNHSYKDQVHQ